MKPRQIHRGTSHDSVSLLYPMPRFNEAPANSPGNHAAGTTLDGKIEALQ